MKKFKKILVLSIMLVFVVAFNVFAENEKVILNPSKTEVKEGETFDLKIDIACETQFNGLTGILQYDEAKLELCEDEDGNIYVRNGKSMNNDNRRDGNDQYVVTVTPSDTNASTSQTIQTLRFKVLEGVANNEELTVSLTDIQMEDGEERIEDLDVSTTVKVISENEPLNPGEDEPTNPGENEPTNPGENEPTNPGEKEPEQKPGDNKTETKTETKTDTKTTGTQSDKEVPKTGISEDLSYILMALIVVSIVSYIGYRKYANI